MELTALLNDYSTLGQLTTYERLSRRKVAQPVASPTLRVTIITVSYNSAATIYHTLESIKNQSYNNIEHIIIDGGSTDNTIEIVKSFPHVSTLVSERDNGIYDAMNKGLRLASGDVIGFLNADDVYANAEVIEKIAQQFEKTKADTLYGDLQYVDSKDVNRVLRNWISGKFKKMSFKYGWMPPHPTFFVNRRVYDKVGGFNLSFRMASDYELMLRILYKYQFNAIYLPEVLVKMRVGGVSNGSLKRRLYANKEDRLAWKVNKLHPYFFTLYLKPLRKLTQYMNREQLRRVPVFRMLF